MGYYFIPIGGSGAKTLEALIHLCVAGILPGKETLNIMAIDPDTDNGNLQRSNCTLKYFKEFQGLDVGNNTILFKNPVEWSDPCNPIGNGNDFNDLMSNSDTADTPSNKLYDVLYTAKERAMNLDQGFRGHPSVGSAVLAKKYINNQNDPNWTNFMNKLGQDVGAVKIFLAGSVFGGTGAAGLPTVSRLLNESAVLNNKNFNIGGALILPYFNFVHQNPNDLFARSENFLPNTKAALQYYSQNDNAFNAMYFIGDDRHRSETFSVGARAQCNNAHIVDFYSALAAIDFFNSPINRKQHESKYICHNKEENFEWADFQMPDLKIPFVKFVRFVFAYVHLIKPVLSGLFEGTISSYKFPWFSNFFGGLSMNDPEIKSFDKYVDLFVTWLKQLEMPSEGRAISLIDNGMFDESTISDVFDKCDGSVNTNLTIDKVFRRICDDGNKSSVLNSLVKVFVDDTEDDHDIKGTGFGKFLRRLYDVCDVNYQN